jgi:hypothetical protein
MRRRIIGLAVGALVLGVFAQPVGASHAGVIADCGSAGTFTVKAHDTGAADNPQAPAPASVTVFEEGGALSVLEFSVNGQLIFSNAGTGRANNNVEEVTCSYTTGDGVLITVTGILTAR